MDPADLTIQPGDFDLFLIVFCHVNCECPVILYALVAIEYVNKIDYYFEIETRTAG